MSPSAALECRMMLDGVAPSPVPIGVGTPIDPAWQARLDAFFSGNPNPSVSQLVGWALADIDWSDGGTGQVYQVIAELESLGYSLQQLLGNNSGSTSTVTAPAPATNSPLSAPTAPASSPVPTGVLPSGPNYPITKYLGFSVINNYIVRTRLKWDGNDTFTFHKFGDHWKGLFHYDAQLQSIKHSHTTHYFSYVDPQEYNDAINERATKKAELPGLKARSKELHDRASGLATTAIILGGLASFCTAASFAPNPASAVLFKVFAWKFAGNAATFGAVARIESQRAGKADADVASVESAIKDLDHQIATGDMMTWHDDYIVTDVVDDVRPWVTVPWGAADIWQPVDYYPVYSLAFGASNLGANIVGEGEVGQWTIWENIPDQYRPYVPR